MNIIHFVPVLCTGGAEVFAYTLAKHQQSKGHNVIILEFFDVPRTLNVSGIDVVPLGGIGVYDHGDTLSARFGEVLNEFKPDIIHAHLFPIQTLHQLEYNGKVVYTVHNVADKDICGPKVYQTAALDFLDVKTVAIGQNIAETHCKTYGRPPDAVIENGVVSKSRNYNYSRPRMHRFGTVSRVCKVKQHRCIIDAVPEGAQTVIVGDGVQRPGLEDCCSEYRPEIKFVGDQQNPHEWFDTMDVSINFSEYEGDPLAIKESMLAGVPVIARPVGNIGDVVDDNVGWIVHNQAQLKQTMQDIQDEPSQIRIKGRAARKKALDLYSMSTLYGKYMHVYSDRFVGMSCD